jgi:hypothetical protein
LLAQVRHHIFPFVFTSFTPSPAVVGCLVCLCLLGGIALVIVKRKQQQRNRRNVDNIEPREDSLPIDQFQSARDSYVVTSTFASKLTFRNQISPFFFLTLLLSSPQYTKPSSSSSPRYRNLEIRPTTTDNNQYVVGHLETASTMNVAQLY